MPLLTTNAQSVRVTVIPVVLLTNDVRVPNAAGIENDILVNAVSTDAVINSFLVPDAGLVTEIDVPTLATSIFIAGVENECSVSKANGDWIRMIAAEDGNRCD